MGEDNTEKAIISEYLHSITDSMTEIREKVNKICSTTGGHSEAIENHKNNIEELWNRINEIDKKIANIELQIVKHFMWIRIAVFSAIIIFGGIKGAQWAADKFLK